MIEPEHGFAWVSWLDIHIVYIMCVVLVRIYHNRTISKKVNSPKSKK